MMKRYGLLSAVLVLIAMVVLSACTLVGDPFKSPVSVRYNTVYDHSELAWYIEQRFGVAEEDCQFYAFDDSEEAFLLAIFAKDGKSHCIIHAFNNGAFDWYQYGHEFIESKSTTIVDKTPDDRDIYLIEFEFDGMTVDFYAVENDEGVIEMLFSPYNYEDNSERFGRLYFWGYDKGRAGYLFACDTTFADAFGSRDDIYGEEYVFQYDDEGRLTRIDVLYAYLNDRTVTESSEDSSDNHTFDLSYDTDGNRNRVVEIWGNSRDQLTYTRDNLGKVIEADASQSYLDDPDAQPYDLTFYVTYMSDGFSDYSEPSWD